MPTYEYRCKQCEHELEAVQGFHDDPLTECPTCGGPLRKKFGSVGISFKGSGFYKNDSRSGNGTKTAASAESGSTDSASAGSSDSGSGGSDKSTTDKASSEKTTSSASDTGTGESGSKTKAPAAT